MREIKKSANSYSKSWQSEHLVSEHLKSRGWNIVCQNQRFFGVEVDILARRNTIYTLVEVKSLKNEAHIEKIISKKQKDRLKAVVEALSPQTPNGLNFLLALVSHKGVIRFIEIE